ncbi:OVARIAN TUMOR DOMAIN-containing deubiquitinating enzyme 7 isoform X3 [Jatropha curcas]|uniref:OVARIAN TUMOR DOMAIN-containing deubiquitinating enzyme 7 isoform X3 n=1 Tax=Jatropha curcas TaxID=180498 RepID=UPI0009D74D8A|nr:OVARIAN TUMOR DOMAIN-containing deubiquitinating enzyme 7 isoform X3 [Jatropha curcas]
MVKTKQQKSSRPKKTPHVKKRGKQTDITQFRAQLDALGLKIIQVTADGNCFFRALADQLEGSEEEHGKYRRMAVQYIMKNREMFEPFIEDDVPFDEYCKSMEKDGTWAGHMELQAASLVTRSNICIHQNMSPRWYIRNFEQHGACMVHLSYHDEEHYNSVRSKEDPCDGPARPIIIKADAELSATSHKAKAAASKSKVGPAKDTINTGSVKLVMAGSGCENVEKVEQNVEVMVKIETVSNKRKSLSRRPRNMNHLRIDSNKPVTVPVPRQMTRRYLEIRAVHVDLKRNISLVVELSIGHLLQSLRLNNLWTQEKVEKKGSKARKEDVLNQSRSVNQRMGCLTLVHFVYELDFDVT